MEFFSLITLVDKATSEFSQKSDEVHKYAFVFVFLFYSFARFLMKSSLACFRFKRIEILVFLQLINLCVWFYFSRNPPKGLAVLFVFALWFGMVGGLCFANTMIQLIESGKVDKNLKELSLNLGVTCVDLAILTSSILGFMLK